jgi:hypothetical protein
MELKKYRRIAGLTQGQRAGLFDQMAQVRALDILHGEEVGLAHRPGVVGVDDIRVRMPHASIGSDVIVGFPGETEQDFEDLVAYLERSPLTHLHVFPYSERPGTAAASMEGRVPGLMVRDRGRRVREVAARLAARFRASQVGSIRPGLTVDDGSAVVTDNAGNSSTSAIDANVEVDNSAPILSFGSFTNAGANGDTAYFLPGASGSFTVTATPTEQLQITEVDFPSLGSGWTGGGAVSGAPYEMTYTFDGSAVEPGPGHGVTVADLAMGVSRAALFTVSADSTAPTSRPPLRRP